MHLLKIYNPFGRKTPETVEPILPVPSHPIYMTNPSVLFNFLKVINAIVALGLPEAREQVFDLLHSLGVSTVRLGHELDCTLAASLPVLRGDEVGVLGLRKRFNDSTYESLGVLAVGLHKLDDHLDIDGLERVPAIVIRSHADDLVGHLGFTSELGLWQGRHVDNRSSPRAVHVGFGASRELGALCIKRQY